ncbi:hypothetical protein GIB67_003697 [Kingdonia uniflora]|uniref:Uncharacterized protein n=1 Tax=Kingdonia uniflora TaxID=39325 RepID=A0A7J7M3W0_9MAGN|nr:hypothetical protein GIB67_003697 [Kingdonia uniflora]
MPRGVKVVIAIGKARPTVVTAFKALDLAGKDDALKIFTLGFLTGLSATPLLTWIACLRHTRSGDLQNKFRPKHLPRDNAFMYYLEPKVALVGFSQNRCLTLFEYPHPLIDLLHAIYHETKVHKFYTYISLMSAFCISLNFDLSTCRSHVFS